MPCSLTPVLGNSQRLDGGAMFGNAPRVLWSRWCAPDDSNRIALSSRALLIREEGGRNVLLETGIGAFFPPELRNRFGVEEPEHVLLDNLQSVGIRDADIDVVVLSHLHFDHAGGLLTPYEKEASPRLLFPRAKFVVGRRAFDRARHPHLRDRASFIPELPGLLEDSGRLELVDGERSPTLGDDYRLHFSDGHTPGLMLTELDDGQGPIVFTGDLIPGSPWMHLPITMGYDRYPELLIDEKRALLEDLIQREGRVFFTHDVDVALAQVVQDERGRFQAKALPL